MVRKKLRGRQTGRPPSKTAQSGGSSVAFATQWGAPDGSVAPRYDITETLHEAISGGGDWGVRIADMRLLEARSDREDDRRRADAAYNRRASGLADTGVYASNALACSRQIGFRMFAAEATPRDVGGSLALFDGRVMEPVVVAALDHLYGGVSQVSFDIEDGLVRGRLDYEYEEPRGKVVVEIKRTATYPLKGALKDGPKKEHWLQGAFGCLARDADYIHIIYVLRGSSQKDVPPVMEWFAPLDSYRGAVDEELQRMRGVSDSVSRGDLPATDWQGGRLEDVLAQRWPCGYCSYKPVCAPLGSAEIPGWGAEWLDSQRVDRALHYADPASSLTPEERVFGTPEQSA